MKINENAREQLMRDLDAANEDLWVEIVSQIQGFGSELAVWVLIDDSSKIAQAYEVFLKVSRPYRERFAETEFSISFDEFKDGKMRKWNFVTSEEIETGKLNFPLGEEYDERILRSTVFDSLRKHLS